MSTIYNIEWMTEISATSFSTIFHCGESWVVCGLRGMEGVVSLGMFVLFVKGYLVFSREQISPLTPQDKYIYYLAMGQTFLLALYYLLFEEFFLLATIRNLLIWIAINVLHLLCQLHWKKEEEVLKKLSAAMTGLKVANFLLWFFISLGDGSSLVNTDFNLGYNCTIIDWMVLSGVLFVITLLEVYIGVSNIDKYNWELQQLAHTSAKERALIEKQKYDTILLLVSGSLSAFIMFLWDYLAYTLATDQASCTALFAGNNFFRNVLCFLLKLITMQFNPSVIYYIVYMSQGLEPVDPTALEIQMDLLRYEAASDFNHTVLSQRSSQAYEVRRENEHSVY